MNTPFNELTVTANTTSFRAVNGGAAYTTGWAAGATSRHGEASIVATAASGKFTCVPGIYKFTFEASIEGPATSDQVVSEDTVGVIQCAIAKGGTVVAGSKSKSNDVTDGVLSYIACHKIVEITESDLDSSLNYVQVFLEGMDSNGNEVLVREARFIAERLS